MLNKGSVILLLTAAFLNVACADKKEEDKKGGHRAPVRVETLVVNGRGMENSIGFPGTIEESESSNISFSTAGTILTFNVREGDMVRKGQVIATLDDSSLKSAYDMANATLAQAQDAFNRMKILHDANSLPEIKWVDVQQKLVQAQSAADIARNALDDAVLRAPVSGRVSDKMADAGQVAVPGIPVVKLIQIGDVKAVISVSQNEMSKFKIGDKAFVSFNDAPDVRYEGTLIEKGLSANPLSRTFEVKYIIANKGTELLPGMICNVEVPGVESVNAIILPKSAVLLSEDNKNFVWLDSMGVAKKRTVTVSAMNEGGLEITSGLSDGEKVIVKGQHKVSNGMAVESIN